MLGNKSARKCSFYVYEQSISEDISQWPDVHCKPEEAMHNLPRGLAASFFLNED